ncbi:E3 ubiquitin-protein ligase RSL1 [Cardamine amara subsp. amara]|uniref:RBR-type E3 ubiquitin transferase n=1 Tax=Cardamine amara subsp. amara TaxID=228776 RepID=A0ABD1A5T9_CARAN
MENEEVSCECEELPLNHIGDEEEFRSCCGDEEVWLKESDDSAKVAEEEKKDELDDKFSVKMFFKGVSISERGDSSFGYSGIGVVLEKSGDFELIQLQKKLEFYVEESVANYLALMDGLEVALQKNLSSVVAVTDSELLYNQITREEKLEIPLLVALRERVLEKTSNLDGFVLKLAPFCELNQALSLAQVAVGIVSFNLDMDKLAENCSICCEDRQSEMMLTLKCTHKFCSHCMKTYVEGKVQSSEVPIRCPQVQCKHYISAAECKSFLPVATFKSFEEANVRSRNSGKIYCPYPNCSFLLDPLECISSGRASASSSSQSENSCCVECPVCERFVCVDCGVPWHASMSCEEFQILPVDERYPDDITLHRLAKYKRWRRCQQCRIMIELAYGCNHMTCRCGHEFCYSCGAEYREGQQTCTCAFWDDEEEDLENAEEGNRIQEVEQWPWDTFSSIPTVMDAYSEQERSQLALIQRFLAGGGFSLSDHQPSYQSPPPPPCTESSYVEAAMKDLHQLPWLERFVSVISDDYYEEYNSQ